MKILGIDSSGLVASVAVIEDDNLLGEFTMNYKKTHSQTLLPMLDELAKMIELDLNTIDAIAVSGGPGSFTGLRIGSATAKGLGLALNKPLIHIPTVDALAYNLCGHQDMVCPLMDARRNQVYTALYKWEEDGIVRLTDHLAIDLDEHLESLKERTEKVIFLGDGAPLFKAHIVEVLGDRALFAPSFANLQHASVLAELASKLYEEGKAEDPSTFVPMYLRKSQAEREKEERERNAH